MKKYGLPRWYVPALVLTGLGALILFGLLFADQALSGWPLLDKAIAHHASYARHGFGHGYRLAGGLGFAVLALGGLALWRRSARHRHSVDRLPDPRELLDQSYAEGSLSREQYLEKKAVLEERP